MKAWSISLLLVAPLLLLPGCASTQKTTYDDAPAQSRDATMEEGRYVAMVERIAQRRGVHVVWVNPPNKPLAHAVAAAE